MSSTRLLMTLAAITVACSGQNGWAERASSFDLATGRLTVPCVDILASGGPAGPGGTRQSFALDMTLNGAVLAVGNAVEISAVGECSARFETTTGIYTDLVTVGDDRVELALNYAGGVDFAPVSVFIRRDFTSDDLTVFAGTTRSISLHDSIDLVGATLRLSGTVDLPPFMELVDRELRVSPGSGDVGDYAVRVEWADQVDTITVHVRQSAQDLFTLMQRPDSLPSLASLNLFSAESIFNTRLPEEPGVDPQSELLMEGLVRSGQFTVQVGQFSATVFFVDDDTPRTNVSLPCGEFWELGITQISSVPVPGWATPANDVDGGDEPPVGCGEDSGQDNFLVILDLENRCEYDFWQARSENGNWVASFGTAFNMDGPGVHPEGLSSRGSGLAFLGGVIWPDEIASGQINHPLAFSYEFPKANGPVAPATDSDGISTEPFALPEGARIQLDPSLDLDSLNLTDFEKTIARAMQEYGLILVDRGGTGPVGFYAIDPDSVSANPYEAVWGTDDFIPLSNLDIASLPLRVLPLPEQKTDFREKLRLASNQCVNYQ
ncbi:MAG: hypothetical protein RL120_18840 [Gammaproteobacteria bacterium]